MFESLKHLILSLSTFYTASWLQNKLLEVLEPDATYSQEVEHEGWHQFFDEAIYHTIALLDGKEIPMARVMPSSNAADEPLTPRECDVLVLIAQGYRNQDIADMLHIGIGTVMTHVHHCIAKLGARNRTHAVQIAIARGIIPPITL